MHNIETIIPAIEAFADRHGVLPATVVRKATGNPRLYDRLKSRADRLEEDIGRIAKFLVENDQGEALPDGVPPVAVDDTATMGSRNSLEPRTGGEP